MISRLHRSSAVSCCRTSRRSSARTRTFIGGLLPTQNISDLPDLILPVCYFGKNEPIVHCKSTESLFDALPDGGTLLRPDPSNRKGREYLGCVVARHRDCHHRLVA